MITIKIGKKKYKGVYSWSDITLQKFCDLSLIPMPANYEAYLKADGVFDPKNIDSYIEAVSKLTDKELKEDFPAYYREVIKCLTNIPIQVILTLGEDKINELYEYYFKPFIATLIYHTPVIHFMGQIKEYQPLQIPVFRLGWSIYFLPKTLRIMDQDIPLANEPIISYSEASDIFRGMKVTKEDIKRLALFMAIYCRKRGEQYDEKKVLQRQELFMKAPMSIVWGVFFYILRRMKGSSMITQLFGSLPKSIHEVVHLARTYKSMVTVH